jgi:hypothetical protein
LPPRVSHDQQNVLDGLFSACFLTIKVAFSNGHLIRAGDKIVVHGEAIPGRPATCIADDVQVTLAHPLSAKGKSKASETEPGGHPPEKQ